MKRRYLSAIFVLVLLFGTGSYMLVRSNGDLARAAPLPGPSTQTAGASDWPQWQKDERHTGYNAAETVLQPPLSVLWEIDLGSGIWGQVAEDGVVYVSTDNSRLYALDAATGSQLWAYQSDEQHISTPAVGNGRVYALAGWGPFGDAAKVIALDSFTGEVEWEQSLTTGHVPDGSPPTISNGVVYVGGGDWALYAFDAATGTRLWRTPVNDGITAAPSVAGGRVFAGTWGGRFYGFDATTGAISWNRGIGGAVWSSSSVKGSIVYIGGGYANHYALNVENGQIGWQTTTEDSGNCPVAVANDVVYIGALAGKLYAYDVTTGDLRWSYQTGGQIAPSSGCPIPAIANGIVYVTVRDGSLVALDADTGAVLATFRTDGSRFPSAPAIANGTLFVGSSRGKLYGLRYLRLNLPFNAPDQTGPCPNSQNGLNCINSYFDHHYPTASSAGDGIMQRFFGDPLNVSGGCTLGLSCYDEHNGYDFQLRPAPDPDNPSAGSLVLAAVSGTVSDISQPDVCDSSHWRGTALRIDHGSGYSTEYWHLSRRLVTSGHVVAGTPIGVVGNTGCTRGTTGTHLHFGTYYGGHVVDPYGWSGPGSDPYLAEGHGTCLWTAGCSTQGFATPDTGGSVATQTGDISVAAPPGAVTDTTLLQLALTPDPVAEPSAVPARHSFALSAQDMSGNPVVDFSEPVTVEVNYSDADLTYVLENTLSLYSWDDLTSAWLPISTVLDLVNNKATADITHLSLFSLMGQPQNPASTIASVSPNSGYTDLETEITIDGTGFLPTPSVRLGPNELAVTFVNSTTLTAVVPSGLDPGTYDLTVINPDAQESALESAFAVLEPTPTPEGYDLYLPIILKNY